MDGIATRFKGGHTNVELGDIIRIGQKAGKLHDLRFIQTVREEKVWMEAKHENGPWTNLEEIKLVRKRQRGESIDEPKEPTTREQHRKSNSKRPKRPTRMRRY